MKVIDIDSLASNEAAKALRGDTGGADCDGEQVFLIGGTGGIACTLPLAMRQQMARDIENVGGHDAAGKVVAL